MTRPLSWWLVPVLFVLVVGSAGANHGQSPAHAVGATVLGGVAGLTLLLLDRNRWAMVVLSGLAAATYFSVGLSNGPIFLIVPLTGFVLARDRAPREWAPPLAVETLLMTIGLLVRSLHAEYSLSAAVWQACAIAAIGAGAAAVGNTIGARRDASLERSRRAATEERLRMAQDLHDGVGHGLAVIAMQAGVALHVLEKDVESARASLLAIRDTSRESLEALRAELSALRPGEEAPARAARRGLADLPVLVDRVRAGGLDVSVEVRAEGVDETVGAAAYAVVQEALTNVLRHARADRARVSVLAGSGQLVVTVADDGQGGEVVEGMGISGMRRRVGALGGTLAVGPGSSGFTVEARLPVVAA
ncbi:sensor histidine kinase [Nocardioides terrisoli]|uniref:sensor histidine kinase n=1 Tax=Nocardioides terrisoli TaxID=3388267 RepID=UPI00287B74A5|nr:sensor histidine kinase [Nocardioides marmorisolisilvae]